MLASCSDDQTVRMWGLPDAELAQILVDNKDIRHTQANFNSSLPNGVDGNGQLTIEEFQKDSEDEDLDEEEEISYQEEESGHEEDDEEEEWEDEVDEEELM